MVQSTVADSIIGALGQIGGVNTRRAQDGLTAAQAESAALENEKTKRLLDRDTEGVNAGRAFSGGYFKNNDAGGVDGDFIGMATGDKQLFKDIMGTELNKGWLTTKDPKTGKAVPLEFVGIQKVDPRMGAAPAAAAAPSIGAPPSQADANGKWMDNQKGPISLLSPIALPQAPAAAPAAAPEAPAADPSQDRYMIMVKTPDGRIVPATQNATADPNDPLITMSADEINTIGKNRIATMEAKGAFGNVAVQSSMGRDLISTTDEWMRQKILDTGGNTITDDSAAKRELFAHVNAAKGDELKAIAKDAGYDVAALEKEAHDDWVAKHKTAVSNVKVRSPDMTSYNDNKALLERLVAQGDQALVDYDKTAPAKEFKGKNDINNAMNAMGAAESGRIGTPSRLKSAPAVVDPQRQKLVASRDAAVKKLAELKPPAVKSVMPDNVPMPKFEWNDDNIRASLMGKLEQPSPEQTAALAKYARDEGVTKAADIAKLPPLKAKALAWVIANNSKDPMATFEKLNNYIQTEDTSRSAIGANVDIAGAQAQQGQVINQGRAVDASIANSIRDYDVGMAGVAQKDREFAHTLYKDNQAVLNQIDDAFGKVSPLMKDIYKGTLTPENKFNPAGPTPEAMAAWKELDATISLPPGSPLQYAGTKRYLEGFMTMAAAQAMKPGATAWWDWTKIFANTFLREDGMVDMSPLVEQAYVKKWKDGKPEEIGFSEGGARNGKPTSATVGAAEFSRYMGTSGMEKFVDSIYFQKAANAVGSGATPEAIAAKSAELKAADGYTP